MDLESKTSSPFFGFQRHVYDFDTASCNKRNPNHNVNNSWSKCLATSRSSANAANRVRKSSCASCWDLFLTSQLLVAQNGGFFSTPTFSSRKKHVESLKLSTVQEGKWRWVEFFGYLACSHGFWGFIVGFFFLSVGSFRYIYLYC